MSMAPTRSPTNAGVVRHYETHFPSMARNKMAPEVLARLHDQHCLSWISLPAAYTSGRQTRRHKHELKTVAYLFHHLLLVGIQGGQFLLFIVQRSDDMQRHHYSQCQTGSADQQT
jgi:hypothetical protein